MAKKEKKSWNRADLEELIEASDKQEATLANLKLQHSQGKLRDTAQLIKARRELARINTFLNQKAQPL